MTYTAKSVKVQIGVPGCMVISRVDSGELVTEVFWCHLVVDFKHMIQSRVVVEARTSETKTRDMGSRDRDRGHQN